MQDSSKVHLCKYGCGYKTKYNSNIHRHYRLKHQEKPPDPIDPPLPPTQPKSRFIPDDGTESEYEQTDLESMISNKIHQMIGMKNNNGSMLPAIKGFMTGSTGSLIAGLCLGYMISQNIKPAIQIISQMMGNCGSPSLGGGKIPLNQTEIQRALVLNQMKPPVPPPPSCGPSTQSPPPSSSIPLPMQS
jgi:hypothetical protein